MLKRGELKELKERAEAGGGEAAWMEYARALERREPLEHAALLWDPTGSNERTEDTAAAHEEARLALTEAGADTAPVQLVHFPATGLIYVLEARGQRSATAHGYQGFESRRAALLAAADAAGVPLLAAFRDGGAWKSGWLAELGPARAISREPNNKRYGWPAGERGPFRPSGSMPVPATYEPRRTEQPRLGED